MNEKLTPIPCGCGGEAWTIYCPLEGNSEYVTCKKCGTKTKTYPTEAEAIQAWNTAMGERTAKVENQYRDYLPYARFMTEELRGNCEKCGETVWKGEKYCHECGARLEWKE